MSSKITNQSSNQTNPEPPTTLLSLLSNPLSLLDTLMTTLNLAATPEKPDIELSSKQFRPLSGQGPIPMDQMKDDTKSSDAVEMNTYDEFLKAHQVVSAKLDDFKL